MSSSRSEKRIKDVMLTVKEFPVVYCGNTVKEAVCLIIEEQTKKVMPDCGVLLVFNNSQNWVGVMDRKMVLRTIGLHAVNHTYCHELEVVSFADPVFRPGLFTECCNRELIRNVEELMYPKEVVIIGIGDTLVEAVHLMTEGELESLVVVENGVPVGLVRAADVFYQVVECV